MKTSLVSVVAIATLTAAITFWCVAPPSPAQPTTRTADAEGAKILGHLPVAFVPNVGQWEHAARYVARVGAMTVFLEDCGWTFTLVERTAAKGKTVDESPPARGVAVRMTFANAGAPDVVAEDRQPGRHNYFLGNDRSKWRSDVPIYGAVRYHEVRPGIDVRAHVRDEHFEYDLLLSPTAALGSVEIVVEGIERMRLDAIGALVIETQVGPVHMPPPQTWEEGPSGERSPLHCSYVLRDENRFGFEVAGRRPGWTLVVDPGLVWSTFLGGTNRDYAWALAVDAQGATTVSGDTWSTGFPTTPGAFATSVNGVYDAFVTQLSATGSSLVYSTFLGGTFTDVVQALALDAQGAATVTGTTESVDFPTTPSAFDTSFNGGYNDSFVTRLSPSGSSLVYSTFLGGASNDQATALSLDVQGAPTVAGETWSTNFPTTVGAFDTSFNGVVDAFVTRLSPTGSSLLCSTYLGGTGHDRAFALALDSQGAATIAGHTLSANFPTTPGAFDTSLNSGTNFDAFVTRLSPTGSSLVYSTFLGGYLGDTAWAIAVDAQGAATVAGDTGSGDFPTTPGAFDTNFDGTGMYASDAFVTRLSPTGASLVYSTFLGGTGGEGARAIAVDAQGAATVAGGTDSTDFPTTPGAFDTSFNGSLDGFVARLSAAGSSLVCSTFLGGTSNESISALALDAQGAATVAGTTTSSNYPTTAGAFDTVHNGLEDTFVTRLDMLATGVTAFGNSSPGCTGPLAISVNSMPQVGNAGFALTCGNAPPSTTGLILFAGSGFTVPLLVIGLEVWLDPSLLSVTGSASSNGIGAGIAPLPIPNSPALAGVRLFAQFAWAGPTSPAPCPPLGFSASNALDFAIQP